MKQYTTPGQTAKLIELGFEQPKSRIDGEIEEILKVIAPLGEFEIPISNNCPAYSIGELIEMLPAKIGGVYCNIDRCGQRSWAISYDPMIYCCNCAELIDTLFDMVVRLKEEGVL